MKQALLIEKPLLNKKMNGMESNLSSNKCKMLEIWKKFKGQTFQLKIKLFKIGKESNCSIDQLEIRDSNNNSLKREAVLIRNRVTGQTEMRKYILRKNSTREEKLIKIRMINRDNKHRQAHHKEVFFQ